MSEGEMESTVSAHGNSGNRAIGAAGAHAIAGFDEGKEFAQKKILVANFAVARVDVKAGFAGGSGDEEIFEASFFTQVFDKVPGASMDEGLLVVAEAVKEIENGKAPQFVGVKAGRQKQAVRN